MSGLFEQIDTIFASSVPAGQLRLLRGLTGGVERWMQVQMLLSIMGKAPSFWGTSSGFDVQRDIRQETYYSDGARSDLLVKNMPGDTNQSWVVVELKHGGSTSTNAQTVANDVARLWTQPAMADPSILLSYGIFLFVPANPDNSDESRQMLENATGALVAMGAKKTDVQQRLSLIANPFPHLRMKIKY